MFQASMHGVCAKLLCTIFLRHFNYSIKWVENGQEAVDLVRKEPNMYNLILMDLRMLVMDGLDATKIIKDELHMKTPVVALTGEGDEMSKIGARRLVSMRISTSQ
jgi:CheY-like chemotaxis protein